MILELNFSVIKLVLVGGQCSGITDDWEGVRRNYDQNIQTSLNFTHR